MPEDSYTISSHCGSHGSRELKWFERYRKKQWYDVSHLPIVILDDIIRANITTIRLLVYAFQCKKVLILFCAGRCFSVTFTHCDIG